MTRGHAPFWKNVKGSYTDCPCTSNLKSAALTVLELKQLTVKNLAGYVTLVTPPFGKILRGHIRTVPGNMCVKFEVRSFNRFGAIGI